MYEPVEVEWNSSPDSTADPSPVKENKLSKTRKRTKIHVDGVNETEQKAKKLSSLHSCT